MREPCLYGRAGKGISNGQVWPRGPSAASSRAREEDREEERPSPPSPAPAAVGTDRTREGEATGPE